MRGKHLIPTIFLVHEACSDRMRIAKNMFSFFCDGVVHSDRIEQSRTFVHLCRGEWQHVDTTCDDAGHPCLPYHLPQHQHLRDVLSSWCHKLSFDKYDKHAQNMFQKTLDTKWYNLNHLAVLFWKYTVTFARSQNGPVTAVTACTFTLLFLPPRSCWWLPFSFCRDVWAHCSQPLASFWMAFGRECDYEWFVSIAGALSWSIVCVSIYDLIMLNPFFTQCLCSPLHPHKWKGAKYIFSDFNTCDDWSQLGPCQVSMLQTPNE